MNKARTSLLKGALKSAVSSACGMVLSLNIIDPSNFSVKTLGGWAHLGEAILITVIIGEARFWQQWAQSGDTE